MIASIWHIAVEMRFLTFIRVTTCRLRAHCFQQRGRGRGRGAVGLRKK